jgi:hypothetical protein
VRRGGVGGLQRGLHATYPAPRGHASALVGARGRPALASCDSAGCPVPRHARWKAAAWRRDMSGPLPTSGPRASCVSPPTGGTAGAAAAVCRSGPEPSGSDSPDHPGRRLGPCARAESATAGGPGGSAPTASVRLGSGDAARLEADPWTRRRPAGRAVLSGGRRPALPGGSDALGAMGGAGPRAAAARWRPPPAPR